MFSGLLLFGRSEARALYGVPAEPSPYETFIAVLKIVGVFLIIPVILTVGVFVYMKKKAYPKKKRIWAIVITLVIYFAILFGVIFIPQLLS